VGLGRVGGTLTGQQQLQAIQGDGGILGVGGGQQAWEGAVLAVVVGLDFVVERRGEGACITLMDSRAAWHQQDDALCWHCKGGTRASFK
jgi:hypothetical protein